MDMDVDICAKICADRRHFTYFCIVIFSFSEIECESGLLSKQKNITQTGIYQVVSIECLKHFTYL